MEAIEQQFLKMYEQYADAIFRHCSFKVYDRELAKDLTQETFLKVWKYMESGKVIENHKAFLYKTALNLIIDDSRKKKAISLDSLTEQGFDPDFDNREEMVNFLDGKRALAELHRLDTKYAEALTLRFVDEFSPSEIAVLTGESENVISVRIHRGVSKLRELLEGKDTKHHE